MALQASIDRFSHLTRLALIILLLGTPTLKGQPLRKTDKDKVPQSTADHGSGVTTDSVDNDEEFYPVADDELQKTGSNRTNVADRDRSKSLFMQAIQQLLQRFGHSVSDLRRLLASNELDQFVSASKTSNNAVNEPTRNNYSLSTYEQRMMIVFRDHKNGSLRLDEDSMRNKIQDLLRDSKLKDNSTLLISMIQVAARRWGQDSAHLPPPFGTLNESGSANSSIIPELREELVRLSELLTPDLKKNLLRFLANDEPGFLDEETAVLEEDDKGERQLVVQGKKGEGDSKKPKREREVFVTKNSDDQPLLLTRSGESGNDSEFTITEDLIMDESRRFKRQEDKPSDISPDRLDGIIRREHELKGSLMAKHRNRLALPISPDLKVRSEASKS